MIAKGLYTSQYVGMSDPTIKCTFEWDMYSEGSTKFWVRYFEMTPPFKHNTTMTS